MIWTLCATIVLLLSCSRTPVYPEPPVYRGTVRIEIEKLPERKPRFFTFRQGVRGINFFVVKAGGDVQSYFDACAKCYPKRLGYRYDAGRLDCRACDVSYPLNNLKDGIGSCYPIKLPGRVEAGHYVIRGEDLLAGDRYY